MDLSLENIPLAVFMPEKVIEYGRICANMRQSLCKGQWPNMYISLQCQNKHMPVQTQDCKTILSKCLHLYALEHMSLCMSFFMIFMSEQMSEHRSKHNSSVCMPKEIQHINLCQVDVCRDLRTFFKIQLSQPVIVSSGQQWLRLVIDDHELSLLVDPTVNTLSSTAQ